MYISKDRRKAVDGTYAEISNMNELTYAITSFILQMWNMKPVDSTIAAITQELVVDQKNSRFVGNLRGLLSEIFTVAEIHTACRMAYDEFYNRVIRLHRALQARENGDIQGYAEAIQLLLVELGTEIKKEAVGGIILPGGNK